MKPHIVNDQRQTDDKETERKTDAAGRTKETDDHLFNVLYDALDN